MILVAQMDSLVHSPPFQVFFKSHTKREQLSPKIGVLKLVSQDLPTIHMSPFCSSKETFLKKNQHSRKICMLPQSQYLINSPSSAPTNVLWYDLFLCILKSNTVNFIRWEWIQFQFWHSFPYYFVISFQTLNFAVVFNFEYFNIKRVT